MSIPVGISSCLLGEKVRYDGGHKLDHFLKETLGQYVSWIPVCPETECGLPTPREAMHLARTPKGIRLVTVKTGRDHTPRMEKWIQQKLSQLGTLDLCGFVFKMKSPSSGMRGIKIYEDGKVSRNGVGLFAKAFMERFPRVPVEDEGRLQDPELRENFITRIFVYNRWREFIRDDQSAHGWVDFHSRHKLLLMAHAPARVAPLGRMVAQAGKQPARESLDGYFEGLMNGLSMRGTSKKNANVLYHVLGYLKKKITADEKQEAVDVVENYRKGIVPLIVPITLLQHHIRKYPDRYLVQQHYLHPHPIELMLRNH